MCAVILSVSSALGNGGSHLELHNTQAQHQHCPFRSQAAVSCSFFGGDRCEGLQHRRGSFRQLAAQLSCSLCACKLSCYGGLLSHLHYHDRHGRKGVVLSSTSSLGVRVCNGSPLQFEQQLLCLTEPLSRFGLSGVEGLLQRQLTSVQAHSQQHLSLQEDQARLLRIQERREALTKYKSTILDSITQHQASLQQSALLSANSQTEGVTVGHVPAGFDVSSCRKVFVGNVHNKVTNTFMAEVFSTVGPLTACRVIRKAKSSYGFVEYQDHHAAAMAISTLNGRKLFRLPIRVNWAFPGDDWEDMTEYHTIFVGALSIDVTEAVLFKSFSTYPSCSTARIIWDPRSGRSKGFGFVSFREREDAVKAIGEMTGKLIGEQAIHCAWAVSKETTVEEPTVSKEITIEEPPEKKSKTFVEQVIKNNPRYTTVYVGNLAHEASREEVEKAFNGLEVGFVEDVQIMRKKGYGFVRYRTHEEAALAIRAANGLIICERPVKCDWGTKPNSLLGLSDSLSLASAADQ